MDSKWIGKSLTIWGVIITGASTVLPAVGPLIGLDLNAAEILQFGDSVTQAINAIGGVIGVIMTVIGRMRANKPLTVAGR